MRATFATLIAEASAVVLTCLVLSRDLWGLSIGSLILKPALVTLVLGVAMYIIRSWNWVLQAFLISVL